MCGVDDPSLHSPDFCGSFSCLQEAGLVPSSSPLLLAASPLKSISSN